VQWRETDTIFGLQPDDRRFITRTSDDEITTVVFGNGKQGARLPTGLENVRAVYRQGLGKAGNVKAEQITQLAVRPLGVKGVNNPLRASGGADKESRDQARKNAPLALMALDRLVSTQDYKDLARTFAGVGKAFARRLSDGRRELAHVTIAGADDIPIDETSDLLRNLRQTLRKFGDPGLPMQVAVRELVLLIISAKVRVLPDFLWEKVAPKIRIKLLDTFSFAKRELGQDALLSEFISAMHSVEGVAYVDVDAFGGVAEKDADGRVLTPKEILDTAQTIITSSITSGKPEQRVRVNLPELSRDAIRPAQLAYLTPVVPDTLILNPI
jgi:predicted phage baseplate assembly protein